MCEFLNNFYTRCRLKLSWSSYHHPGTYLCRISSSHFRSTDPSSRELMQWGIRQLQHLQLSTLLRVKAQIPLGRLCDKVGDKVRDSVEDTNHGSLRHKLRRRLSWFLFPDKVADKVRHFHTMRSRLSPRESFGERRRNLGFGFN